MKSIIPLQYYRDQIPEVQIKNMKNDGVKFQSIFNKFVELGIKGARRKNKVREDLDYYVELGFFIKFQNENQQPLYYQTHIGGDLKTDMYLAEGIKFVKALLGTKFKKIDDEWQKLDKEKLFYKQKTFGKGKYPKPTKKLERWIMLFDPVIVITQNLMWTRETMDYDMLKDDYSKLIANTIKELNQFAKLVHSTSEDNERAVEVIFSRMPFRMTF